MNYKKIHDSIIDNAKMQKRSKKEGIFERHHIIMTSMGGPDTDDNTVLLTPKEHFIVHYLLWKMNPDNRKFRDPIFMFKSKGAANSRLYEAARIEHILNMKNNNPSLTLSVESKASKSRKLREYVKTEEHCRNISRANTGKATRTGAILSDDTKTAISESVKRWHSEVGISEETREKHRQRMLLFRHSEESKEKSRASALKRKRYECPLCSKQNLDGGNFNQHMKRLHKWDTNKCKEFKKI